MRRPDSPITALMLRGVCRLSLVLGLAFVGAVYATPTAPVIVLLKDGAGAPAPERMQLAAEAGPVFTLQLPGAPAGAVLHFSYKLEGLEADWTSVTGAPVVHYPYLPAGDYRFLAKAARHESGWGPVAAVALTIEAPWYARPWFFALPAFLLMALAGYFILGPLRRRLRHIRRLEGLHRAVVHSLYADDRDELHSTAEIEISLQELHDQKNAMERQRDLIQQKSQQIEESMLYARRIQTSILPQIAQIRREFADYFIFYKPKDIVSGDFYWFSRRSDATFMAAIDCTGHGIPGAFMSVVGYNLLNQIINDSGMNEPDEILLELNRLVRMSLRQASDPDSLDGMDIALCVFSPDMKHMTFSGANRPVYLMRGGAFTEIAGSRYPVGGTQHRGKRFERHEFILNPGDRVYLFTDGVTDQFGGPRGRKFSPRRLREFIESYQDCSLAQQGDMFNYVFDGWMENHNQLDDLTFIGIEIPGVEDSAKAWGRPEDMKAVTPVKQTL